MREIVIDTETTGLDYKSGDRVIEVGCVELINHVATSKNMQFYCFTEKNITSGAAKVHGITNDFLKTQKSFKENALKFLNFIANDPLIIHNAEFDVGFINNELKLIGNKSLTNEIIDTLVLARKTLNTRTANLDYLCRRFGIDISERKIHGALKDASLLAEVYLELIGGKQISLNLDKAKKEEKFFVDRADDKKYSISKVKISNDEILAHDKLVKSIKNSLWKKINY